MKWVLSTYFCLFAVAISAQEVPNGSFETWESEPNGNYEEPGGDWWATMNLLRNFGLFAPVTVKKTTDAQEGQYAVEITSDEFGSFLIPGLVVSGEAGDFDINNPTEVIMRGQPFTGKPEQMSGYYKYFPVSGDSGVANATLTKFNTSQQKRDTVGVAEVLFYNEVSSYTLFEANFDYWQQGVEPDTIVISLVSSAGGQDLQGQIGSKLLIDDLQLSYTQGINMSAFNAIDVKVFPNPAIEIVSFAAKEIAPERRIMMYDNQGKLVLKENFQDKTNSVNVSSLVAGKYLYAIEDQNTVVATGTLIKAQR